MAKKVKSKSKVLRFIKIVLAIVIPSIIVLGIIGFGYFNYLFNKISTSDNGVDLDGKDQNIIEKLFQKEERITIAAFGVDKDGMRTDTIVIGSYESKSGKIDLISIPRDTYIELDDEMYNELNRDGYAPRVMKINELHAYAGTELWYKYVIPKLEDMTGLKIDHYVKIDLKMFKKVVDLMGGIKFDVPMRMYYNDPYQNLHINLQKGEQVLNGDQAEMLIRFRKGYSNGDIGRVETQQKFMSAFISQAIDWFSVTKLGDLVNAVYEDVSTDMSITDIIAYGTKYLGNLNLQEMQTHIIPGNAQYINGISYYVIDEQRVKNFVQRAISTEEPKKGDSSEANIQVLNGGSVNGLATKYGDILKDAGYTVDEVGTFSGERLDQTRIIVAKEGLGTDLIQYFTNAEVVVDASEVSNNSSIKVIIGLDEK